MFNRLNSDDWDVLIYVASYISGYAARPTQFDLHEAGLSVRVVMRLLRRGCLTEINGGLEPVLQAKTAPVTVRA
ncbi:MAG: hypothetical protein KDD84_21315 [Caldilineaceae bacterium]|nr:hypothetical protein [Caldilineaceae bacterium]